MDLEEKEIAIPDLKELDEIVNQEVGLGFQGLAGQNVELKKGSLDRGGGEVLSTEQSDEQNFLFMWGCRPSAGVLANTEMVRDLIQVLETNYDKDRMRMVLPAGLEHLNGKDANFEMVTSNTIQQV